MKKFLEVVRKRARLSKGLHYSRPYGDGRWTVWVSEDGRMVRGYGRAKGWVDGPLENLELTELAYLLECGKPPEEL